jgi:membrane associated rhomboid family serine protease
MFPVGDDDSQRRTTPYVTYALVGLNVLVFLIELSGGDQFIEEWSFIPARFSGNPEANAVTIFTAMFMHGGWLHLFGNMLYLWIFGDNVEDQFGHLKFLIFYLLTGIAATSRNMPSPRNRAYPMSGLPVRSPGCSALIS